MLLSESVNMNNKLLYIQALRGPSKAS